jgi:hypothetical protein
MGVMVIERTIATGATTATSAMTVTEAIAAPATNEIIATIAAEDLTFGSLGGIKQFVDGTDHFGAADMCVSSEWPAESGGGSSIHARLLMVPLEPVELCNHHFARRDQRARICAWVGVRQEDLGIPRIRSRFLCRIVSGGNDQIVDHFSGPLDALGWDAAAMGVAQKEATGLRKLCRIGGPGHANAQEEEQGGRHRKS